MPARRRSSRRSFPLLTLALIGAIAVIATQQDSALMPQAKPMQDGQSVHVDDVTWTMSRDLDMAHLQASSEIDAGQEWALFHVTAITDAGADRPDADATFELIDDQGRHYQPSYDPGAVNSAVGKISSAQPAEWTPGFAVPAGRRLSELRMKADGRQWSLELGS